MAKQDTTEQQRLEMQAEYRKGCTYWRNGAVVRQCSNGEVVFDGGTAIAPKYGKGINIAKRYVQRELGGGKGKLYTLR
jgi:hypothetical protein